MSLYGSSQIGDAFRLMEEAKHVGKDIVRLDDPDLEIEIALEEGAPLDPDGTYLVTGGVSGFGRAVGEWLVAHGAGRVMLASRNTSTSEGKTGSGRIETLRLDVTDAESVTDALQSMTGSDKPLRGIVHAAVVYVDAVLEHMTAYQICRVLEPKIVGSLNLARAVENSGAQLDFFV